VVFKMFKPTQLPFLEYRDAVKELKRRMDRENKSSYPMVAIAIADGGQVLCESLFKNVWDRKPVVRVITDKDWHAEDITVEFYQGSQYGVVDADGVRDISHLLDAMPVEKVTPREPNQFKQLDYFEDQPEETR
jgi:hypothetical protein